MKFFYFHSATLPILLHLLNSSNQGNHTKNVYKKKTNKQTGAHVKRFLCFFIFSVFLLCSAQQTTAVKDVDTTKEKFVIGCHGAGFFSIFFGALNNITWCEQNNKIPVIYWNKKCHYYQPEGYNGTYNAWKYYFEPVSELSYEQGDKIFKSYFTPSIRPLIGINPRNPSKKKRTFIKEHLIDRYIKIKPSIAQKIEDFYLQNMAGKKKNNWYSFAWHR